MTQPEANTRTSGSTEARQIGRAEAEADDARQAFVDACARLVREEQSRIHGDIAGRERELARISAELRAVSRGLRFSRRRLSAVDLVATADTAKFERDFDDLRALPGVRAVSVDGTCVRVLTGPLSIQHEGRAFRIGEFAIDLDLEHGIRITNLANTSRSTGWDHPHVQGGAPCLGNLQEGAEMLLGELELVTLTTVMMQFLETYNPTTAYGSISLWHEEPA